MEHKKIDIHTHFGLNRVERAPSPWNPQDNYTADAGEMVEHLKSQGVFSVLSLTGTQDENCGIRAAQEIVRRYPGFFHFSCNFSEGDAPEAVYDRMCEYKELGAVSVGELAINQWIDSPLNTAVFEAAEKLGLPVTFHMSPEPGYAYGICDRPGLPLLEEALKNFPKLKFFGHSQTFWIEISGDAPREGNQARSKMGDGPVAPGGAVPRLLDTYPNLYGDLSAYSGSRAVMRDEVFGLAFLERYQDRLMYGSDTINSVQVMPLGGYLDSCVEDGRLSREAYEKICYQNAQKLLNI
jgi:predicted TIM-barrel fold metal-dependent hydrolase